jgi:hypothetical protein
MPVGRRDGVPSVVATRWYSRIIIPCWRQASRSSEPARIRTTAQTGSDTRRHGSVKTRAAIIESFRSDDIKRFAAISSRRLSRNRFFGVPIAALSPSRSRSAERPIHIRASGRQLVGRHTNLLAEHATQLTSQTELLVVQMQQIAKEPSHVAEDTLCSRKKRTSSRNR